jgi:hypothetical protein
MVPCLVGQAFLPVRVLDRQECLSYKKIPRQTTRDFISAEVFSGRGLSGLPELFSGCFPWPQVALTHHVFHSCLYALRNATVKHGVAIPTSNIEVS